jgi:hypothetical protein
MYAKSVEHAARKNTALRETAYESLAARCNSGSSCATSVVECRIRLIICGDKREVGGDARTVGICMRHDRSPRPRQAHECVRVIPN